MKRVPPPLLALLLLAGGCTVVDDPYPPSWDPLTVPPSADCRRFEGTYADRGEAPGRAARPSLTRELLGEESPWETATSVRLELAGDGAAITVLGADKPYQHHFSAKASDYSCEQGKLVLRNRRWVASGLLSGRESVRAELHESAPFLVARMEEKTTGVIFIVVPLAGESTRWFRFARLPAAR